MIEVAVEVDDVHAVVGNMHHPVCRDEQRPDCLREFRGQRVQLGLGNPHIADVAILRHRPERVFPFRNVTDREYADAVDHGWLETAIAIPEDTLEKLCAQHALNRDSWAASLIIDHKPELPRRTASTV